MARKRYKPEEIVAKLRQVDVLVSQGQSVVDAVMGRHYPGRAMPFKVGIAEMVFDGLKLALIALVLRLVGAGLGLGAARGGARCPAAR